MKILAAIVLAFGATVQLHAQGTFGNLNFESARPPFNPNINGWVSISNALPRWTAYMDGPRDWVLYNNQFIGGPSVSLTDSLAPYPDWFPIQGSYSVYLFAGAGIGQTGQIPTGATSLFFLLSPGSHLVVSFQGQNIPIVQFGTSGNNLIMAGNISQFAGQTGELLFAGGGVFDAIQLSNQPIPEPSSALVLTLGLLAFGCRKKAMRQ